jgi:hypothetical protein
MTDFWNYLEHQLLHREIDENREACSVCGDEMFWWELREEGRCPICDLRVRMPDPPRRPSPPPPPRLAQVIDINQNRRRD